MNNSKITEFNNNSLRNIAREMIVRKYAFIIHSWVYFFVNLIIYIIYHSIGQFAYPWFLWPIAGGGTLLLSHGFTYWIYRKGIVQASTIGFAYHLFSYVLINILLLFIACFTNNPRWKFPVWGKSWFYLPLLSWGFILVVHFTVYLYVRPKPGEPEGKRWLDRLTEKEYHKMKQKTTKSAVSTRRKIFKRK